jgi:hypothetical protein
VAVQRVHGFDEIAGPEWTGFLLIACQAMPMGYGAGQVVQRRAGVAGPDAAQPSG